MVSLCRFLLLSLVPFPHEGLRPFLYPLELTADLLCGLALPVDFDAERVTILLEILISGTRCSILVGG